MLDPMRATSLKRSWGKMCIRHSEVMYQKSDDNLAPSAGWTRFLVIAVFLLILIYAAILPPGFYGETVPVRHREGLVHGFLVLSTVDGEALAHGDLIQIAHRDRLTLHLRFDFKDGSVQDETTIYSQSGSFRVLNYRLIQKGPSFPHPSEIKVNCITGEVTVHSKDEDGKEKTENRHLDLPPDMANGIVSILLKNVLPDSSRTTLSFVAATPKPRLVKLLVTPQGEDSFSVAGTTRKAINYLVKVNIGGVVGVVAPLIGKQPADTHVWILGGTAPAFVKSEGPLYAGGPIWRIELVSPIWRKTAGPVLNGESDADKTTSPTAKPER